MRRWMRTVAILLVGVVATGCAHALSQPMPDPGGRLALKVVPDPPSKMHDMPLGVHQVPDTAVYVSGHQGAAGVGMLFGIIGVAVAHAAAQSTGEKKTQDAAQHLKLDVVASAERILADELARLGDAPRLAVAEGPVAGTLQIAPFVVLTFVGNERVRPWVVLNARLKNARDEEQWKTRYIAGVLDTRPLAGEGSWTSDTGAPIRQAVDGALRRAVSVFVREASGRLARGGGRQARVKTQWVWVKEPMEFEADILDETEDTLIVVPKVADGIVFAGVNILDRSLAGLTTPAK